MSKMKSLRYLFRIGGIKLLGLKMMDKIMSSDKSAQYIYQCYRNAKPADYPRMLSCFWENYYDEKLDLKNPRTFNEKIQWMKLYDSTPIKTRLADKYLVRDWVKKKIGEQYLVPLLGVWDGYDEIDFDSLPQKFVLKCNHGSGMNYIVKDKDFIDHVEMRRKFSQWMKENYAFKGMFELQYKDIHPKIIAECYLEELDGNLMDYKIHVFNGKSKFVQIIGDRDFVHHEGKQLFLSPEWTPVDIERESYGHYDKIPPKPQNFEKMIQIAEKLAEGFNYVRVDLYNLNGKIIFGEMTFTPASGFGEWGGSFGEKMGEWIELPNLSNVR